MDQKPLFDVFEDDLRRRGWKIEEHRCDGAKFRRWDGLTVIGSVCVELDGKQWLHLSASWPTRVPTWDEMQMVKELFIGRETYAVMVSPPRKLHVNINPHVLHWWHCLEGHPLPEFSRGLGTI